MRAISKRLRLSPKTRPLRAVAFLACALLLALLLWSHGGGTGDGARPCRWGCASKLLAETNARLLRQFTGQPPASKLYAAPVLDATHPHVLALCESCDCDVCGHYQNTGAFAPVEVAIFDYILAGPLCDGTRAVVDVGANIGTFALQAAAAGCAPVVALEPNPLPFLLAEAGVALNGYHSRVTLLQLAAGDAMGRAKVDRSADADARWGHASILRLPPGRAEQLRARGVGDTHSHGERAAAAGEGEAGWGAAQAAAAAGEELLEDEVAVVPLSEIPSITRNLLLLKIDVEGGEAEVLAGTWSMWDSGRVVENVVLECKLWNSKSKRDLLRHLARSAGLRYAYTYREMYEKPAGGALRRRLGLEGRMEDVSSVILNGEYGTLLPHEDFWLRRDPVPAAFLIKH